MFGFEHNADAARRQVRIESIGNLLGETLLQLRPTREHIDRARQFRQAHDASVAGQICDMRLAEKGQQVMLTHAAEIDPADQDELVGFVLKSAPEVSPGIVRKSAQQVAKRSSDATRRIPQAFTLRVLTDSMKYLADRPLDSCEVDALTRQGNGFTFVAMGVFRKKPKTG